MTVAILWICAAITATVFAVMLYSVATFDHKQQRSSRSQARRLSMEMLWFTVPILIFVSALLPILGSLPV